MEGSRNTEIGGSNSTETKLQEYINRLNAQAALFRQIRTNLKSSGGVDAYIEIMGGGATFLTHSGDRLRTTAKTCELMNRLMTAQGSPIDAMSVVEIMTHDDEKGISDKYLVNKDMMGIVKTAALIKEYRRTNPLDPLSRDERFDSVNVDLDKIKEIERNEDILISGYLIKKIDFFVDKIVNFSNLLSLPEERSTAANKLTSAIASMDDLVENSRSIQSDLAQEKFPLDIKSFSTMLGRCRLPDGVNSFPEKQEKELARRLVVAKMIDETKHLLSKFAEETTALKASCHPIRQLH